MSFPQAARKALGDTQLRRNLGHATRTIREKRAAVVAELPDWQELREAGRAIKDAALYDLEAQLVQLESAVQAAGGTVLWARDGEEANRFVAGIARGAGADEVV
ncbi:MAG: L-lactate dehydrogenase complex protein LldF, partial [Thermoleophilaceae bacterium]|nr:L-lactate dehydrogenase complex protein LldF [Thermoleophilaceae bacterium]